MTPCDQNNLLHLLNAQSKPPSKGKPVTDVFDDPLAKVSPCKGIMMLSIFQKIRYCTPSPRFVRICDLPFIQPEKLSAMRNVYRVPYLPCPECLSFISHLDSRRRVMAMLENALVQMIRDSGDKWLMIVGYPEPEIRRMVFGMQRTEKTEEFAITYKTNITNIHRSWLPYGMPKQRIPKSKLFAINITVGHWGLGDLPSADVSPHIGDQTR